MKALAIGTALLSGMMLVSPTAAEEQRTTSPRYVGAITGNPERDSFGYLAADLLFKPQAAILLSEEARYVGLRTDDEEKDTFARVEVRRKWTAELDD